MVIEPHPESIEVDKEILLIVDRNDVEYMKLLDIRQVHVNGQVYVGRINCLVFFEMTFDMGLLLDLFYVVVLLFHRLIWVF